VVFTVYAVEQCAASRYRLYPWRQPWHNAVANCLRRFSSLAVIENASQQSAIVEYLSTVDGLYCPCMSCCSAVFLSFST